MKRAPADWVRGALWAAIVVQVLLAAGSVVAEMLLLSTPLPPEGGGAGIVFGAAALLVFPAVGGLLLHRRPANRVGWLFCVAQLGWALNNFGGAYVRLHAVGAHELPLVALAVWFYTWPAHLASASYVLLLLWFPDGWLPSPRWRLFAAAVVVWAVVGSLSAAFAPGPVEATIRVEVSNPLGLGGSAGEALTWLADASFLILAPLLVGAAAALVARYRCAGTVQRLQLKWILSAAALSAGLFPLFLLAVGSGPPGDPDVPWAHLLQLAVIAAPSILIPVAAGLAILRHGLYEIDRIVSRTVSYALITGVLVAVYGGSALALGQLLGPLAHDSQVAVAASTLLVAALFRPVRERVQSAVDRRFNRARYDAQRTVDAFAARLRNAVDIDQLSDELVEVVRATVDPAAVWLWLRTEKP